MLICSIALRTLLFLSLSRYTCVTECEYSRENSYLLPLYYSIYSILVVVIQGIPMVKCT